MIKQRFKVVPILLMVLVLIILTACGSSEKATKTYKWGDTEFEVKGITDDDSVIGNEKNNVQGKCVAVTLDFGKAEMSQSTFEGNVNAGKLTLAGEKPKNYNYHLSNMQLGANGFESMITGETILFFDMPADYTIKEDDLKISE